MTNAFTTAIVKATKLTRSGRLHEATALIQRALAPRADGPVQTGDAAQSDLASGEVIEGSFSRIAEAAPAPANPAPPVKAPGSRKTAPMARDTLAETLRKIAAGGMPPSTPLARTAPELPAGARFLTLTHTSEHGSRDYRLYVPAYRTDALMPLVVMLHGCTQSPEDFAVGTGMNLLAEEFGCLIAYPAQPSGANAQKCWNWFRPQDQRRDRGEPELVAGLARDILRDYPADPARVYIAGLSAGGAAAAIVAAAYPDVFSAVGVHSGLPVGAAADIPSAFSAMRTGAVGLGLTVASPTIVFHGLADSTVHPDNSSAVIAQALASRKGLVRSGSTVSPPGRRSVHQTLYRDADGRTMAEHWQIEGAGHAWAGGQAKGSYTDPKGPDASREMLRFFLQHRRA